MANLLPKPTIPNTPPPNTPPPPGQLPPNSPLSKPPVQAPAPIPIPGASPSPAPAPIPAPGAVQKPVTNAAAKPAPAAPAADGSGNGGAKPLFAKAKKSPFKFLPIVIGVVVLIGVIIFAAMRFLGGGGSSGSVKVDQGTQETGTQAPVKQTVITYWGLWEPNAVFDEVIQDFSDQNPGAIIEYKKNVPTEYRERLQSAIASGRGPDVFRYHASWVPMLKAELDAAPSSVITSTDFQKTYYPVMSQQLISGGKVLGLPLMYDGLGLYYNKKALQSAGVSVPETWADLKTAAQKLTITGDGGIERAGVALGSANNVEHFSDILGLLIVQNGGNPADPSSDEAIQALDFYTDFVKKTRVWSAAMPSSTVAFARGDAAMMIAPSWRAHEVMSLNPDLDFAIAPAPKLSGSETAWATYWAEGVSSQSENKDLAWKFVKYLSSEEVLKKLYSAQSQIRSFGEIYPRIDMATEIADSPYAGAYLEDAPQAVSWYLNSFTHDNGINDRLIKYYEDAVNAVVAGDKDADEAMGTVASGSAQVLRQYSAN